MKRKLMDELEEELLECEKLSTFLLMIAVGGFFGAYTYTQKGGVFCNAQTANFVMLAIQMGEGNWGRAFYYFIPISAYLLGTILSEFLPNRINRFEIIRWDTFFVAFEMLVILLLGFIPDSAPPQLCQISINFIASMQYNTFRQARKVPMATTFCTNHVRQLGINLVKWVHKGDKGAKEKLRMHCFMLICFVVGGVLSTILGVYLNGKAIWGAEILLLIVFIDLLHADRVSQRDKIHVVPHGH